MVIVYFLWFNLVCSCYVAPGENVKAKLWKGRICRRKLLLDKLATRIHILFVATPWIAPIGGTIFEVKSNLQLQEYLCVTKNDSWVVVKVGSNHDHLSHCLYRHL